MVLNDMSYWTLKFETQFVWACFYSHVTLWISRHLNWPRPKNDGYSWTRCSCQATSRITRPCYHSWIEDGSTLSWKIGRRHAQITNAIDSLPDWLTSLHLAAEDNLNISLKDITVTGRDGRVSQLDQVYIRGSMVRFFIVPDMLQNAPMWENHSRL